MLLVAASMAVSGCRKEERSSSPAAPPPPAAASAPPPKSSLASSPAPATTEKEDEPDPPDPAVTPAMLEEKFQRGELTGAYRPIGIDLVVLANSGKVAAVDRFPEALHKHGESIGGAWVASDGTLFAAGYMVTGLPGPDTGVVYRRDAQSKTKIVYTRPGLELAATWGRSRNDVFAGGRSVLVHWDGAAWTDSPLGGVDGAIIDIWGTERELYLVTNTDAAGSIYRRTGDGGWVKEASTDCGLRSIRGFGTSVWAAGGCGVVLHRNDDGTWKEERRRGRAQLFQLAAVSPTESYAAGGRLLHGKNGEWSYVSLPLSHVYAVVASGPSDVYALGTEGVFHGAGTTWKKVAFDATNCQHLVMLGASLACLREHHVAVKD